MRVILAKLYEDGGRPLARHRAVSIAPSHEGILSLHETHDRELRRTVRKARVSNLAGTETILELYDAVVLFIDDGVMTIAGIEMFVEQAAHQFETWTGETAPRSVMEKAVLEALGHPA